MGAKTQTKPRPKTTPRRKCQWCPKYLITRRGALVCRDCDLHERMP